MRIPKNVVTSTFSICLSSISILQCRSGLLACLFLNIMKIVLSIFRDSFFLTNWRYSLIHYLLVFLVGQGLYGKKDISIISKNNEVGGGR